METYKYVCNHSGKGFELETPEAKECPFCFWRSSVHKEGEVPKIDTPKKKMNAWKLKKLLSNISVRDLVYGIGRIVLFIVLSGGFFLAISYIPRQLLRNFLAVSGIFIWCGVLGGVLYRTYRKERGLLPFLAVIGAIFLLLLLFIK